MENLGNSYFIFFFVNEILQNIVFPQYCPIRSTWAASISPVTSNWKLVTLSITVVLLALIVSSFLSGRSSSRKEGILSYISCYFLLLCCISQSNSGKEREELTMNSQLWPINNELGPLNMIITTSSLLCQYENSKLSFSGCVRFLWHFVFYWHFIHHYFITGYKYGAPLLYYKIIPLNVPTVKTLSCPTPLKTRTYPFSKHDISPMFF